MDVVEALTALGGVARRRDLVRATSRWAVVRAIERGLVVRFGHGRYRLPVADEAVVLAHRATGALCLTSAALHHGWEVKVLPTRPQVVVPKHRRLARDLAAEIHVTWVDLAEGDADGVATSSAKTLEMCLRRLPFDEALVVADSALRHGFPPDELAEIAGSARGPGSAQLRRVAGLASADSANVFESTLKAIAADVPGLHARPQVVLRGARLAMRVRPDLVDVRLRLVLEADSFTWHGSRSGLRRDARRYNALVVNGWAVLRFSWEDVMHEPGLVRRTLLAAVDRPACPRCA